MSGARAAPAPAFSTLFRLYDLPGGGAPAGCAVRRLQAGDRQAAEELLAAEGLDPALAPMALARFPVPAVAVLRGGTLAAAGFYDLRSPAMVGPVAARGGEAAAGSCALLGTLRAMRAHGYRYAADAQVPAAFGRELAASCAVPLAEPDLAAPAAARDIAELPWADLFGRSLPAPILAELEGAEELPEVEVRTPEASERLLLVDWAAREFGRGWASEIERAFAAAPISCLIAVRRDAALPAERRLLGFTGYDLIAPGIGSTIAIHPQAGDAQERAALFTALGRGMVAAMELLGYEFMVAAGISKRRQFLDAHPGSHTIPGSYPGLFSRVIPYK